ncbi:MAG: VOC family protein [Bacteroidales bacterium]
MKFCWTTIQVCDMKESLAFYQGILELEVNRKTQPAPGVELVFLGHGDTQIELICDQTSGRPTFSESLSLGFEVPSLDQFIGRLQEKGIALESGPVQPAPFIRFAFIRDPNGLKIQLVEHLTPEA